MWGQMGRDGVEEIQLQLAVGCEDWLLLDSWGGAEAGHRVGGGGESRVEGLRGRQDERMGMATI